MDRERFLRHMEKKHVSRRDMLAYIPLGTQPDALWEALLDRRRANSTTLPLRGSDGAPYWYVTTERMIAASEKTADALIAYEAEPGAGMAAPIVSSLEEVFFTSFLEGSRMTMQEAMTFLQSEQPARDVEEQLIVNNRRAAAYAGAHLHHRMDENYLRSLAFFLTDGLDVGGQDLRAEDTAVIPFMRDEPYAVPSASVLPELMWDMVHFLDAPAIHPLIKASAAQAWVMTARPFPEGNERLGRILSNIILLRAGYLFFSDVSLSALIARQGYAYYEAAANVLRAENGGDMTYFIEFFLDLLARAIDERQLRIARKEEQTRATEHELARQALVPPDSPNRHQSKRKPVRKASSPVQTSEAQSITLTEEETIRVKDALRQYANMKPGTILANTAIKLSGYLEQGKMAFRIKDIETDFGVGPYSASDLTLQLREQNIIEDAGREGRRRIFRFCRMGRPVARAACSDAMLERLELLSGPNGSPRDRRVAKMITESLAKGAITLQDYMTQGISETVWNNDKIFAEQMGLAQRVSAKEYRILKEPAPIPSALSHSQKKRISEIYTIFGDAGFSVEMAASALECSESHMYACLHRLMMFRVLEYRRDIGKLYRFLVNPRENPEYFADVA